MPVVMESSVWEPHPWLFLLIFLTCLFSIFLLPHFSKKHSVSGGKTPAIFDHGISSPSFLRFQRNFLLLYALASVLEGMQFAIGEFEFAHYSVSREQIVLSICVGHVSSLFFGTFLGAFSDLMGQKKFCVIFYIIHLFVGLWKRFIAHPSLMVDSICVSLSASIFSFSFETWMVVQHEKQGHRRDTLNDIFWLMSFFEAACMIQSQVLSNWLIGDNVDKNISSLAMTTVFVAMLGIICIAKVWAEVPHKTLFKEYKMSFQTHIFGDKKVWLLVCAQASLSFSVAVFWILWAPTVVADGREVHLGLIFPCLVGSRMLGSTIFPWLIGGLSSPGTEDFLVYGFSILGLVLSITAYDYQEIGVLVTLFCLFNASVGLILPSLAKLRTLYVPNELRGGMISLSQAPAHAAILFFLVEGGYYRNIGNAAIMAIAALGLFSAAGCMHVLKRWGKQPYQNVHKL